MLFRSQLYVPCKKPGMLANCAYMNADAIILDLEDSIAQSEKDTARILCKHTLQNIDFQGVGRVVRCNAQDTEFYADDLEMIVPCKPDAIRLPKVETADNIREIDERITRIEKECGIPVGSVKVHAMLETAQGVLNAESIAHTAKGRLTAITLGGQDLAADMGIVRTKQGTELLFGRSLVVLAARSAKIMAIDTPYTNLDDPEGLIAETKFVLQLGYSGKAAIHPSQCKLINDAYAPDQKSLMKAIAIVAAAKEAEAKGIGVISVNGKMVDKPVVEQAKSIVARAKASKMPEVEDL